MTGGPGGAPYDPAYREAQRELEESAVHYAEQSAMHYAEQHPDPRAGTSLTSIARRVAARLRRTPKRRPSSVDGATASEAVWAREEALYRAKNEGSPGS